MNWVKIDEIICGKVTILSKCRIERLTERNEIGSEPEYIIILALVRTTYKSHVIYILMY